MSNPTPQTLEKSDIQGLVRHGYPYFDAACYEYLAIEDPVATRAWLQRLLAEKWIDDATICARHLLDDDAYKKEPEQRCGVAVAFTAAGLRALGLDDATMRTFVGEFQEGMAVPHRSRSLGDVGESCPTKWRWGGPQNRDIHILLVVFAPQADLRARVENVRDLPGHPTVVEAVFATRGDQEPFGFADGVSQPKIEGLDGSLPGMAGDQQPLKAGEFVLGYADEFGHFPASPSVAREGVPCSLRYAEGGRADLGRNGTFLVVRELEQDVTAFNEFVGADAHLAARMVGRWRSGAALVQHPNNDPNPPDAAVEREIDKSPSARKWKDVSTRNELVQDNEFAYRRDDPHGFSCPLGSHVRRANPRDSLAESLADVKAARAIVNRHRILRRGRRYQRGDAQGVMFLCLNTNIERQFEFVQRTWLMNPEFHGLRAETDPLIGNDSAKRSVTAQCPLSNTSYGEFGRFITVRGGGYFFLPGIAALSFLSRDRG